LRLDIGPPAALNVVVLTLTEFFFTKSVRASGSDVRSNTSAVVFSVVAAIVLLVPFLPLPRATTASNHTWRVELASGLLLSVLIAVRKRLLVLESVLIKRVLVLYGVFTLWSFSSILWAYSSASVLHDTLLWSEYLLVLCFASGLTRRGPAPVLHVFYVVVAIVGVVALLDYLTLPNFADTEGSLRIRYGVYGELLVTVVPVLWAAAMYRRKTTGWLLLMVPAAVGWTAAMFSLSKGVFISGLIGFAVMFAGTLIFGNPHFRRRTLVSAAAWIALTVLVQSIGSSFLSVPSSVDYISGRADVTRETSIARVFMWRVGYTMSKDHLFIGAGADNFGIRFNEARAEFRREHPDNPSTEVVADFIAERAHDEPLQVLAELGVVGLILFIAPVLLVGWMIVRKLLSGQRFSPMLWAAVSGMTAFGASSLVSSFSFRASQNGIAFFLVLAVAIRQITKGDARIPTRIPVAVVASILIPAIFIFALKGAAEISFAKGDNTALQDQAIAYYTLAERLDPDYAAAWLRMFDRSYSDGAFDGAANYLRRGIARGMGQVVTYSLLAECYEKSGHTDQTDDAFKEALDIFPRSVFLRVRYGIFLHNAGRGDDANRQFAMSRDIDVRQANGWYDLLMRGSLRSYLDARESPDIAPPDELDPSSAVLRYLDKPPIEQPR
jgi:O-antigen ligase